MADKKEAPILSRRERELLRHRGEIMAAATSLFSENGFHQTTVQMIADRADFSVGYLYKHFESKEQIYQATLDFHHGKLDEAIVEVRARGLPPLEELYRTYEAAAAHFNQYREFLRIYHNTIEVGSEDKPRKQEEHRRDVISCLERAVAAGEIKPVNVEIMASAIFGAAQELFKTLAKRDGQNPLAPLPDTLFELLIDPLRIQPPSESN